MPDEQMGQQEQAVNKAAFIGGISQLNARKPLSSFFTYNLMVYSDGLLFVQEKVGEVLKTAGVMGGAVGGGGVLGGALGAGAGGRLVDGHIQNVFEQYMDEASSNERNTLISDPKNHWCPKDQVMAVSVKKGWFIDKLTITLTDGTILKCSSKRGYKQRDNMTQYLPAVFPQTTIV